ncbi:hypothetical protein EVAR_12037_1 [Eumeta japonica]|uniref:Uncharacterized protein n=1 Tax=Eumeta variegata TaxID=151549 RepID=A0A4C1U6H9_EUMVA|nr:hypothetical protein EVAR_12037_1 [Eumeta japonica]
MCCNFKETVKGLGKYRSNFRDFKIYEMASGIVGGPRKLVFYAQFSEAEIYGESSDGMYCHFALNGSTEPEFVEEIRQTP